MKTFTKILIGLFAILLAIQAPAQTFWIDDFEDGANPTTGTRNSDTQAGGSNAYFGRTQGDGAKTLLDVGGTPTVSYTDYTSISGARVWAGEDHDGISGPTPAELNITWTGINIAGKSNIEFKGLFAAATTGFEVADSLVVEYRINGAGNYITGLKFIQGNGNGWWTGSGSTLSKSFSEYKFPITGTGNTLDVRVRAKVSSSGEEWAIDNFRLGECNVTTPTINISETSGISANDGIICLGASVTLSVPGSFTTYEWSQGGSNSSITVNPTSDQTYSVTVTNAQGCSASASQLITVNNPPANPTISATENSGSNPNDGTICAGASVTLAITQTFTTYSWSPGGASTQSIMVTPSSTTTYNVTVTNAAGCSAPGSRTITVNPIPSPTINVVENSGQNPNDGITCSGGQVMLSVPSPPPGSTFSWSPGGASTSSITVNPVANTMYSVTVTAQGCSGSANTNITVNTNPAAPTIAIVENSGITPNDGNICQGDAVTLSVGSFSQYSWSPGGATTSSITVSPTMNTTYGVTVSNANSCTAAASQAITVSSIPAQNLTTTNGAGPFCADGSARTLRMQSTTSGVTYQLLRNGTPLAGVTINGTGGGVSFSPAQTVAGVYTAVAANANGCTRIMNNEVVMIDPDASVDAGAAQEICQGGSAVLAGDTGGAIATWTANPAVGSFSPNATTPDATFTPPAGFTGAITLTLTTNNAGPCPASNDNMTLTVNPRPTVSVSALPATACEGIPITLTASGNNASTFSWALAGSPAQTGASITLNDLVAGNFAVTVTATSDKGCTNTATQNISVKANPVITPIADITIPNGGMADFSILATAGSTVEWELDTVNIDPVASVFSIFGTSNNISHKYSAKSERAIGLATYFISALKDGCSASETATVRVFPVEEGKPDEPTLFIPELLSPNGDGVNDEWIILLPSGRLPQEYSVYIRDRTGCMVFEGTLNERFDASKCPNGVYYYVIIDNKNSVSHKGGLTIITTN